MTLVTPVAEQASFSQPHFSFTYELNEMRDEMINNAQHKGALRRTNLNGIEGIVEGHSTSGPQKYYGYHSGPKSPCDVLALWEYHNDFYGRPHDPVKLLVTPFDFSKSAKYEFTAFSVPAAFLQDEAMLLLPVLIANSDDYIQFARKKILEWAALRYSSSYEPTLSNDTRNGVIQFTKEA